MFKGTKELEVSLASSRMANLIDDSGPYPESRNVAYRQSIHDTNNDFTLNNRQTNDKLITPRSSPALSLLASNMNPLRNPLAPQLYDPSGGFVIFFDFILHVPTKIETCTLITSIHHPKSGLGTPSPLPPLNCEEYIDEKTNERMHSVIVATKQPVPRFVDLK